MGRIVTLATIAAVVGLFPSVVVAQDQNFPPVAEIQRWTVRRDTDGNGVLYDQTFVVYDAAVAGLDDPANIGRFVHYETDIVTVILRITDADWTIALDEANAQFDPAADPPDPPDYEGIYIRFQAFPTLTIPRVPYFIGEPPNAPPIVQANDSFYPQTTEGFGPDHDFLPGQPGPPYVDLQVSFYCPEFLGRNQGRLDPDNPLNVDIGYDLTFSASNEQDPVPVDEEDDNSGVIYGGFCGESPSLRVVTTESGGFTETCVFMGEIENPGYAAPNPPPDADATTTTGALIVAAGTTVGLDATRSFDAYNIGFTTTTPRVFEEDSLEYTWEWISGPERIDPIQQSIHDPIAFVTLIHPSVTESHPDPNDNPYVYRVLVDDGVNPLPSTAIVKVKVVDSIPVNQPPTSIITGPASAVTVGTIITLDGSQSSDPDPADIPNLKYHWRQTNALGEDLAIDDLKTAFQPVSGVDSAKSKWQAIAPGTYYFRLLVSDEDFITTSTFTVTVVDVSTGGVIDSQAPAETSNTADLTSDAANNAAPVLPFLPACGAGFLPFAIAPLMLLALVRLRPMR